MSKKNLVLVGGGGHCKSVIEAIKAHEKINIIGILDTKNIRSKVLDIRIIGNDSIINDLVNQRYQFMITVGNVGLPDLRIKLFDQIKSHKGTLATIVAPNAIVAKSSTMKEGTIIMQEALVNAEVTIGKNCIINTGALIEHETKIGNHVHVATNVTINGQCKIGNNCFIGSGSVISNNISIADNVIIGAGSVVIRDINEAGTYYGNPARLKKNK